MPSGPSLCPASRSAPLAAGALLVSGCQAAAAAGETAGDPAAAVGVRLGHARCRGLSPSIPSSMKDSGDSKDQQLMVRPHHPPPRPHPWPRLPAGLNRAVLSPQPPLKGQAR